jgi:hypothetical protein
MRTTWTPDPDVASRVKREAKKLGKPLKEIINAVLQTGLDSVWNPRAAKPYRTEPRPMGLRQGCLRRYKSRTPVIAAELFLFRLAQVLVEPGIHFLDQFVSGDVVVCII